MQGSPEEIKQKNLAVSRMAETLIGSEIIRLAGEINEKIKNGEEIYNLTIGDFDPKIFPIPAELEEEIVKAYREKQTNYPPANGIAELRNAVSDFINEYEHLYYCSEDILIAAGARPLIYAVYQTIVEPGEKVIFPVPSWNNNHYTHLSHAQKIEITARAENNFMPSADDIKPFVNEAALISLCSPLNPTGTVFSERDLSEICEIILEENNRRDENEKPLYLLYDQIYWMLTFGSTQHYNPVSLYPEMTDYTIFIDGLSKSFAATGVRVGWAFGPHRVIDKMKSILSHLGAWAPKAEQIASARYLNQKENVQNYLHHFKGEVSSRLNGFYNGFMKLKSSGFKVDAIAPQAAIYLTVKFELHGMKMENGEILHNTKEITKYILEEAKVAIVPFYAFGDSENSPWYRLSVGTCRLDEVEGIINNLEAALEKLKP
jgi:aspartate aminotransferase